MSAPKRSHEKWLDRVVATVIVMVSYQATHYATAARGFDRGAGGCLGYSTHMIGRKEAPAWVDDCVFLPANAIDDLIGIDPSCWRWH